MMAYLIVLLVLGFLLQRRSLSNALDGITHRHWTSAIVVEPDERFDIITELRNTSRRFVPFLRMQESLPLWRQAHRAGQPQETARNPLRGRGIFPETPDSTAWLLQVQSTPTQPGA